MGLINAAADGTSVVAKGQVHFHQGVPAGSSESCNWSSVLHTESVKVLFETTLVEIHELRQQQVWETEKLQERLTKIEQQIGEVPKRLQEAEQRISDLEDKLGSFDKVMMAEQKKIWYLENKVKEKENHVRRSNLRFTGIPEGTESQGLSQNMIPLIALIRNHVLVDSPGT
ncbi:hypothetical protein NDU88_002337 [Pleurodeles waltl]|uniref:Uncharacterized protein n=1 Tax=Pleurodeles waltl TaxID=8319 RepID=A0AAV7UXA8_PLEWA|nr:hypothetical protein NDU88_002337 [Pleurodeles waltl]